MPEETIELSNFKQKGLNVVHLNIRSVIYKIDQIRMMISQAKIDVLCLSESWLNPNITDSELSIEGYKRFRKDRTLKKGGGILIYIKDSISYDPIETQVIPTNENVESGWIQLNLKFTKPILLGTIYKPPQTPVGQTLKTLTDILSKIQPTVPHEIYIIGDFNIDTSNATSPSSQKLKWFCIKNGLDQLISKPTRSSLKTSSTIDLILTNCKSKVPHFGTININISDHLAIFFNRKILTCKPTFKIIKGRSYSHYDKGKFIQDLQDINWHCIVEERNTTEKWCRFKNIFIDVCNVHAPMKDMKITQNKPKWLTNDLYELMNVRDTAYKKAKVSKSPPRLGNCKRD